MSADTPAFSGAQFEANGYRRAMHFGVLGTIEAADRTRRLPVGGPKQRTVLALLISRAGTAVSTDALVDGVYGDEAHQGARRSVQTYVSNLRSELGEVIEATGSGYVLRANRSAVDAFRFEDAIAEATGTDDPDRASEILRDALALWRGHPYADVDGLFDLTAERTRLTELRMSAIEARVDTDLARGHHRQLIAELDSLTEEHPLRERFRAQQMLALYRCDRQAEALRAYEKTRTYLVDEVGLDPSPDLRELEQRILDQDPSLGFERGPAATSAAILVADVADPWILGTLSPTDRYNIVTHQSDAIRAATDERGGSLFAHRGSAIYASFDEVEHAVHAAVVTQQALAEHEQGMRMAISVGEVQTPPDDVLQGPPVTRAAQLASAAYGGQVLLSPEANQALAESGGAGWVVQSLGQHDVDGSGEARPVYQLVVDGLDHDFPSLRSDVRPLSLPVTSRGLPGYELREEIGSGAFGVVHRAYQPSVGREVAIKIVRPEYANDPRFIRRFEVEAQLVARLEHPHIVPLHDYWRNPDGAYLVMRWLGGGTLHDEIANGPLSIDQAHSLLADIGPALAFSHRRGVVHRDIKPSNVLLDDEGGAYLTDFGIASDIALHGAGSVAHDVQALAMLLVLCVGDSSEPAISELLATATTTEAFPDVRSFISAWEEAAGVGDATSQVVGYTPTRNPYKGLSAFGELDAADFHGRDAEIIQIVETLAVHPLVAVVGPSGIGKSSVVRAGMIPALRQGAISGSDGWLITDMLPGAYPYEELASALMRVATEMPTDLEDELRRDTRGFARAVKRYLPEGQSVLLIVDQFEELFTLSSGKERTAFLEMLAATISDKRSNVRIVITMRADFFDRPLRFADLGDALRVGTMPVSAPTDEGLHAIVSAPAADVGVAFESGLIDRIVGDVKHQPGALPLLEFSLTELFDERDSDLLTLEAYETSGGVLGALGRRTEATYANLDHLGQEAARETFLRLVNVAESGRDTRRRVRLTELERLGFTDLVLQNMLNVFGEHRLLTFDRDSITRGPTVEVAHEAILTEWPRLTTWIDEHREDLLLRSRLAAVVAEWDSANRSDTYLLTAGRLDQHETWTEATELTLTTPEREFLVASRTAEDDRTAKRRRTRRLVTSSFGLAAIIALVLAAAALAARNDAQDQAGLAEESARHAQAAALQATTNEDRAESEAAVAQGRELVLEAEKVTADDPELAVHLAIESIERFDVTGEVPVSAVSALRDAAASDRVVARVPGGQFLEVSPDGSVIATAGEAGGVALWDSATMTLIDNIVFEAAFAIGAWYGADGREIYAIIISPETGSVAIEAVNLETGAREMLPGPKEQETLDGDLAGEVSGTGDVAARLGESLTIWDRASGEMLFERQAAKFGGLAYAIDGRVAYIDTNEDGLPVVAVVDGRTGEPLVTSVGLSWLPTFLEFSPDGTRIAMSDYEGRIGLVDLATGSPSWPMLEVERARPAAWSADSSTFAVGGERPLVIVDAATGTIVAEITTGSGGSLDNGYIGDTDRIATSPGSEMVILNASEESAEALVDFASPFFRTRGLRVTEDGGRLVLRQGADGDGFATLDASSGRVTQTVSGQSASAVTNEGGIAVLSSTGEFAAAIDADLRYRIWPTSGGPSLYAAPEGWAIIGVNIDASLTVIKSDSEPNNRLVSTTDDRVIAELDVGPRVFGAEFSPDSRYVITNADLPSDAFKVWDTSDGKLVARFGGEGNQFAGLWTRFVPSGAEFVNTTSWGDVFIYDFIAILAGVASEDAIIRVIPAHDNFVGEPAISSDGLMLATSSSNEPTRLWEISSGKLLGEFGAGLVAGAPAFHPFEPWLFLVDENRVRAHTLDVAELIGIATSNLTREMTDEECLQYLHEPCSG